MIANIIIIAIVALVFGLCLKKLISGMKKGGCDGCCGGCSSCAGCHHCPSAQNRH